MTAPRRTLAVRISEEARNSIDAYCRKEGITVTAWIEALGKRLDDLSRGTPDTSLTAVAEETVRLAREIDAKRRARPKS